MGGRETGVVDGCDRSFKCNVEFWWSANACLGSQNAKIFDQFEDGEKFMIETTRIYVYSHNSNDHAGTHYLCPMDSEETEAKVIFDQEFVSWSCSWL